MTKEAARHKQVFCEQESYEMNFIAYLRQWSDFPKVN